jgi:hypothetical protein
MISRRDAQAFEQLCSHLSALSHELAELAKKEPNNPLNLFKATLVRERLMAADRFLTAAFKPFATAQLFGNAEPPSTSDAVLMVSQYLVSLERWRSGHLVERIGLWYWDTQPADIPASPPTHFSGRTKR